MSDVFEFGFDEAKVIKTSNVEQFKQSKPGEKTRLAIVSFKKLADVKIAAVQRERGAALSDAEKAEIHSKADEKIAAHLTKKVSELTEADRLDIRSPRFAFAYTHYKDGVGSIRCLSEWSGSNVVKPALCCEKMGEATQTVATVVMTYPVDSDGKVDRELLSQRKYVSFYVWRLSAKKFQKVNSVYDDARQDDRHVIDLRVTLDGDVKFQKQIIEAASVATWARDDMDKGVRDWILDQGIRIWKHVPSSLGFEMKADKLAEKLNGAPALAGPGSENASAAAPRLVSGYDDLLS